MNGLPESSASASQPALGKQCRSHQFHDVKLEVQDLELKPRLYLQTPRVEPRHHSEYFQDMHLLSWDILILLLLVTITSFYTFEALFYTKSEEWLMLR
jgi:hypothetical protein